jgi:hypothetical protein
LYTDTHLRNAVPVRFILFIINHLPSCLGKDLIPKDSINAWLSTTLAAPPRQNALCRELLQQGINGNPPDSAADVLLRDILFPPPLANFPLHLACLTLSVLLLCMLTFFYARKNWKSYSKSNLWTISVIDMLIATLYNYDIYIEPVNEFTDYLLVEIWIRPTISYGLVACFVTETDADADA